MISVSITNLAHSHCGFMSGIVPIDAVIVKSVVFGQSGSLVVAKVGMQMDRSSHEFDFVPASSDWSNFGKGFR